MIVGSGLYRAVQCSLVLNAAVSDVCAIKYSSDTTTEDKLTPHVANNSQEALCMGCTAFVLFQAFICLAQASQPCNQGTISVTQMQLCGSAAICSAVTSSVQMATVGRGGFLHGAAISVTSVVLLTV